MIIDTMRRGTRLEQWMFPYNKIAKSNPCTVTSPCRVSSRSSRDTDSDARGNIHSTKSGRNNSNDGTVGWSATARTNGTFGLMCVGFVMTGSCSLGDAVDAVEAARKLERRARTCVEHDIRTVVSLARGSRRQA